MWVWVWVCLYVVTRTHVILSLCTLLSVCVHFLSAYLVEIPWKVSSFVLWKWKLLCSRDKLSGARETLFSAHQPKFPMRRNVLVKSMWERTSTFSTLLLQLLMLRVSRESSLPFWLSLSLHSLLLSASLSSACYRWKCGTIFPLPSERFSQYDLDIVFLRQQKPSNQIPFSLVLFFSLSLSFFSIKIVSWIFQFSKFFSVPLQVPNCTWNWKIWFKVKFGVKRNCF